VSVNFHRAGSGPTLVLLHGIGHHWQTWRPVIGRLIDSFDVIACDSSGRIFMPRIASARD
jgi:pimeloyl-ACP methyl ester carboxylesterase